MNNKIITSVDTNLISLGSEEVSNSSIVKNELLIKELIYSIKQSESYIANDDILKIHKLDYVNSVIDKINGKQDSSIDEVAQIIKQLENYNHQLEKQLELEQLKSEQNIANITLEKDAEIDALKNKLAQITNERDNFENKYHGQKNRKVIRFIDKVAK